MKRYKIITCAVVAAVLVFAFWYGGNAPSLRGFDVNRTETAKPKTTAQTVKKADSDIPEQTPEVKNAEESAPPETLSPSVQPSQTKEPEPSTKAHRDEYRTDPVPSGKPQPAEPQDAVITDTEHTCTLSVRCDTILKNISWLKEEKRELVPQDGVIYQEKKVTFYEGESVFNLLVREMKRNKIHMEFVNTPVYNSAYIEGIANLYEFDCGELSGWMYSVNGWFPNYGCSRYQLKEGDKVEWVYTCDLGKDVGGNYAAKNGE